MSVPPYAVSTIFSLVVCYTSDHIANRGIFAIIAGIISACGYIMFLVSTDKHTLYGSLFLMIIGAYTSAPILSTWMREFTNGDWCRTRTDSPQPTTCLLSTAAQLASS
jgi:hypothetical protein